MTTRTGTRALGSFAAWFTLSVCTNQTPYARVSTARDRVGSVVQFDARVCCCNANHSNRTQKGRGIGNKAMMETLTTLDVRKLEAWQLEEAQAIWRDFSARKFQSFHRCAVDPARIELDERLVRDMLGLDEAAVATVGRLRTLLATDPSIHGSKKPEVLMSPSPT